MRLVRRLLIDRVSLRGLRLEGRRVQSERDNADRIYHRQGEGNDGVPFGVYEAAGPQASGIVSQITAEGGRHPGEDDEGENGSHFEAIDKISV